MYKVITVLNISIYLITIYCVIFQYIEKQLRIIEGFDLTIKWIHSEQKLFQFPLSEYPLLDEIKVNLLILYNIN